MTVAGLDLNSELEFARTLCDVADTLTLRAFNNRDFLVTRKIDRSEVTEVDRTCEMAIREIIERDRTDHAVIGEEYGTSGNTSSHLSWIIDPIDGTSNFVRGIPIFATLVALADTSKDVDNVLVGVVSAPALGLRWSAAQGLGAWRGDTKIHVSDTATLPESHISITFNDGWEKLGLHHSLSNLARQVARPRGFGDFWQHMLVAEGALDAAIDAIGVERYDLAALKVIVEESGGMFTDRNGSDSIKTKSAISSNTRLHELILNHLSS